MVIQGFVEEFFYVLHPSAAAMRLVITMIPSNNVSHADLTLCPLYQMQPPATIASLHH